MSKSISKLLPIIIFILTVFLGALSIVYSLKISEKESVEKGPGVFTAEEDDPPCGDYGYYGYINCSDQGQTIPIAEAQIKSDVDFYWDNNHRLLERTLNSNTGGKFSLNGETDVHYATFRIKRLYVLSLPETVTLQNNITLPDGRSFPAGTQIPTSGFQGPRTINCTSECFYEEPVPPRQPTPGDCSNPAEYRECRIDQNDHNFSFRYTNCFPAASPSPSPKSFVCQDLTRTPAVDLELGDTVTYTCSHQAENVDLDHYEFRMSIDGESWWVFNPNSTDGISGTHTVQRAGTYRIQCRACAATGTTPCTDWGQAGGWVE